MNIITVPIASIEVTGRRRPVSPEVVEQFATDIADRGLRQPIEVAAKGKGKWRLVAGGNRLAACHSLGWEAIPAIQVKGTEPTLRRDVLLENLVRNDLTKLERCQDLSELRVLFKEENPTAGRGGDRRSAKFQTADSANWSEWAAARCPKMSARTIRQYAATGDSLDDAADTLRGSPFAENLKELDALTRQPPKIQRQIAGMLVADDNPAASVAEALGRINGKAPEDTEQKALTALVDRWHRMPKATKRAWVMTLPASEVSELAELLAERGFLLNRLEEAA